MTGRWGARRPHLYRIHDAGRLRDMVVEKSGWAFRLKSHRKSPVCFSPWLYYIGITATYGLASRPNRTK